MALGPVFPGRMFSARTPSKEQGRASERPFDAEKKRKALEDNDLTARTEEEATLKSQVQVATCLTVRAAQMAYARLCADAGLPKHKRRIHTLRHTRATWAIEEGCPILAVQALLGHSSPRITSETYCHPSGGWVAEQIRAVSRWRP